MLRPTKTGESFVGKLLLSSALVAVSLAYGWWQRHTAAAPATVMAPSTPKTSSPPHKEPITTALVPAAPAAPTLSVKPDTRTAADEGNPSRQYKVTPAEPRSTALTMAKPPQTNMTGAPAAAPAQQDATSPPPAAPATLSAQASLEMYAPTDEASPPLPLVTGTPPPGVFPSIPTGTHLQDGDYLSDKHQFEWGDLVVKISIHGGQITAAQIVQYPDHRSQSLFLSQMAGPILESEVIKTQQSQVDAVSSATDTSYAFQDAIANIIVKATRG